MNRRPLLLALLLALLPWMAAAEGGRYFFVSHAGVEDAFWRVPFQGATDAAREHGLDLSILAPETVNDYRRQVELLEEALAQHPAGIATTVSDPLSFAPLLARARSEGVPVIAVNSRPEDDDRRRNPYLAYIGMDDRAAGRELARQALKRGRLRKGGVLVLFQQAGHAGLEARYRGIAEAFGEQGIAVERLDISGDPLAAEAAFRAYVATHPGLAAVVTLGPEGTHPVGRVLHREGLDLYFAAFDLSPLGARMIRDGLLDFVIDQQPYLQGYLAIELLRLAAEYRISPPDVNTGIGIIDRDNLATVEALAKRHIR